MVQIRRPRGDRDPGERGEVLGRLHPVLHVAQRHVMLERDSSSGALARTTRLIGQPLWRGVAKNCGKIPCEYGCCLCWKFRCSIFWWSEIMSVTFHVCKNCSLKNGNYDIFLGRNYVMQSHL